MGNVSSVRSTQGGWIDRSKTVSVDIGGDLSISRHSPWYPTLGYRHFCLSLGWSIGIVGLLAIELCNHGITGQAGTIYVDDDGHGITDQPSGIAGQTLLDEICTSAGFIALTFSPGVGNSGTGKYLTDENHTIGSTPILSMKL